MLRQDPTECLFSFICTSNNHISRIQGMVERLCQALGTPLCKLDETSYYGFPSLSVLAGAICPLHMTPLLMFHDNVYCRMDGCLHSCSQCRSSTVICSFHMILSTASPPFKVRVLAES